VTITAESEERNERLLIAVTMVFVVACGLLIGCLRENRADSEAKKMLAAVTIPIYPQARGAIERVGSGGRNLQFHVPVRYPAKDVLQFYKRELEGEKGWVSQEWGPVFLGLHNSHGQWYEAHVPELRQYGRRVVPTGKSLGTSRSYEYLWYNPDSDLLLWLWVKDYSLVDDSRRPAGVVGSSPDQFVILALAQKSKLEEKFKATK